MKKRQDGMYERKVWIPQPDGTLKRKSFYDADKRILDVRVNEIENQINKGTYVLDSNSTFEQNIKKWFEVHGSKKEDTTVESYGIYTNHAIKLLGKRKLQEIKPMHIQEAYNKFLYKEDGEGNKIKLHSENSLKHLHVVVNMAFEFAVNNSIIYKNPCDKVEKIKVDKFRSYVYSESEFTNLLNEVHDTDVEIIVLLAGAVGLRAGEICGLQWTDIDEVNSHISVNRSRYRITGKTGEKTTKTDSSLRTITVDRYIIKRIMSCKKASEYILCRNTLKPFRNDELYHKFVQALDRLGMPKTRLHDLRHYNATMMAFYGVDIKTAATRLGHASTATTMEIYQHVLKDMDIQASKKLGAMLKPVVKNVVNKK